MTKAEIVQRLLDEQHITAEEAVVLLSSVDLKIQNHNPIHSWFGAFPSYTNPYTITAIKKPNE